MCVYLLFWRRILASHKASEPRNVNNSLRTLLGGQPHLSLFKFSALIRSNVTSSRKAFNSVLLIIPRSAVEDRVWEYRTVLGYTLP